MVVKVVENAMIIDSSLYQGRCKCGREHTVVTQAAIIAEGCLLNFEKYMEEYGIDGKRCVLYGANSYKATEGKHPRAEQELILNPEDLHADERSTAFALERIEEDVKVLIAVGSGTIHDITRFCAHERGIRFVSCPTAASVDGFCSTVASMTWCGYKKTVTAVAPELVIADVEVIREAPPELVRSGIGDIMAKYIALADWEISHRVAGEYLCPTIYGLTKKATDIVMESIPGICRGESDAYAHVTYALIISGIAMQMIGNSRPASGAEHHISHMIEMGPQKLKVRFQALHGEKTGVGALVASREYHRLRKINHITPFLKDYTGIPEKTVKEYFGGDLAEAVMKENEEDCLSALTREKLSEHWEEIRDILERVPKEEFLYGLLEQLDAKRSLEDIGISEEDRQNVLEYSPLVRNRLTLMRMRRMINA